jgi:hypothetical protein
MESTILYSSYPENHCGINGPDGKFILINETVKQIVIHNIKEDLKWIRDHKIDRPLYYEELMKLYDKMDKTKNEVKEM